jgi:sodium/potassium-transporting ATPase subunit alpha
MFKYKNSYDVQEMATKNIVEKNDLKIAVCYHSLSADTQNEIDIKLQTNPRDSFKTNNNKKIENNFTPKSTISIRSVKIKPKDIDRIEKIKRPEILIDDHIISMDAFLAKFKVNKSLGLTEEEVKSRRERDGINILSKKRKQYAIIKFIKELVCGYNFIMWACAILCMLCYKPLGGINPDINNLVLSCLLFGAIFFQGTFSYFQHKRSDNLMSSFEKLMPHVTTVLRDGHWKTVNTWELVIGDIVRLTAGDKIPADMRVIECSQASVEKSSLTGESEPVKLNVNSTDLNPYETKNITLFGSSILEGTVTGVVFQTGDRTIMGKIAEITLNTKTKMSTMQREINYFASIIGTMSIFTGILTFVLWYFGVRNAYPDFLTYPGIITACIGVVVSFFPEGLPISVTMTLTLVAQKMKKNNVLIKKMSIIETLGSTTVIASDKTGRIKKFYFLFPFEFF